MKDGRLKTIDANTSEQSSEPGVKVDEAKAEQKLRPWEKMPREVWELLQEMQDDADTYVSMTMAVVKYLFTGEPSPDASEFKGANRVVYMSMCQNIDRYKAVSELRAKAGKRGGKHKRRAKEPLLEEKEAKNDLLENKKAKAEKASRVKSEEGRVKSEEYTDNKLSLEKKEKNKNKGEAEKKSFHDELQEKCVEVGKMWNACIIEYSVNHDVCLRPVKSFSEKRMAKVAVITGQYSMDNIRTAFENCMKSPFCNGRGTNPRKKPVDFDWIMGEDTFIKLYENNL